MKISFTKLSAQEMVDRGIKKYVYVSPTIIFAVFLVMVAIKIIPHIGEVESTLAEAFRNYQP